MKYLSVEDDRVFPTLYLASGRPACHWQFLKKTDVCRSIRALLSLILL